MMWGSCKVCGNQLSFYEFQENQKPIDLPKEKKPICEGCWLKEDLI